MARLPRLAVAGRLHLVIQRGHNREPVFADAQDRAGFLRLLREAAREHGVAVHAFALPPTEVLLLATPAEGDALGRMMQATSRRFVRPYNQRHGRSGALWEGRFASTVVDPQAHGLACLRWVDAAAQGVDPNDATASSAAHHDGRAKLGWLTEHLSYWHLGNTPFEREARFRELLAEPLPAQEGNLLRSAAMKGWVLGDKAFEADVAASTRRRVAPLGRGRPRRPDDSESAVHVSPINLSQNDRIFK